MLKIPTPFLFKPFFIEGDTFSECTNDYNVEDTIKGQPFYYDMHPNSKTCPWKQSKEIIPFVFKFWRSNIYSLEIAFKTRNLNEEANDLMVKSISFFIISLFWINDSPVKTLNVQNMNISSLKVKPINCQERLSFIIDQYNKYHAFIQLQQLFSELEKGFYKHLVINNIKK